MQNRHNEFPLLTIAIATRNRAFYALSAIKSILRIQDPRLQLVVQDNSDSTELEGYIRSDIRDERLRYQHTRALLAMNENFNAAVELASGEYLCFIGDDDGLNPQIMEAVEWAKAQCLDAVRSPPIANYFWPDLSLYQTLQRQSGRLYLYNFTGKKVFPDVESELLRCALAGGQGYLHTNLPKVYHGIIKKQCLDRVKERTGCYFMGLSPDIFGSIAAANFTKRLCSIDYPLTISGTSLKSGAGDSAAGKHSGPLSDAPHLRNRKDYKWPDLVPQFYSVETIWAESTVTALRESKRMDILEHFDVKTLQAACLISHPKHSRAVWDHMRFLCRFQKRNYPLAVAALVCRLLQFVSMRAYKSINYRVRRRLGHAHYAYISEHLDTIADATVALNSYLHNARPLKAYL